jgi:hypothetical protein
MSILIPPQIKVALIGAAAVALFASGWTVRGWYESDKQKAAIAAQAKAEKAALVRESEIAAVVEEHLTQVNKSRGVVYRETIKTIQKPVYVSDCIDGDGLSLINQAAGYPAEPVEKVPATAKAGRH